MTREEAINKIRQMRLPKETMEILEALVPELAESEDERIRKLLIWQVHLNIEDETNDLAQSVYDGIKGHDPDLEESIEDWKKCLAYLEKQKDSTSNNFDDERIRRWLCDYFSSIDKAWIHKDITCIDILRWLEKQKEQKQEKFPPYVTGFKGDPDPAGTSDLEEAAKEYVSKTLCDPDDGPSTGLAKESFIAGAEWQKEQKPAEWSEEDEEILKLLILNIGRYMYFGGMSSERILSFLKSLRPQQRQEWSEEEKEILDSFIR